jgi:subtilisin family serine protease
MVGIKFLGGSGGGYLSDGVKSISYATKIGVDLTSNSWGGGGFSSSMKDAIDEAAAAGIGFIAAAGNHAGDNDAYPSYPASYESENVISVGANDHFGKSAYFSCYGKTSVDLFAPGVNILSTIPGNGYASYSGTSMATPHVAGAYALILAANPDWQSTQVKNVLLDSVDAEDNLAEKCLTGGRLNILSALSNEPPQENLISVSPSILDFGFPAKEESRKMEFILSNRGNADTTVTGLSISASAEKPMAFEVSLPTPFVLEPNMAQTGTVSFFGPTEGIYKANLFVHSDASNDSNLSIPLLAEVITTPDIVIDPQELHFGLQEGDTQKQVLSVTNRGDGDLVYSLQPRNEVPWLIFEHVDNGSVPAGATVEITVQTSANQMPSDFERAIIDLTSNDPDTPSFQISVSAERLSEQGGLVFRPEFLEYGDVFVGHSTERKIEMFNSGLNPISINRVSFSNSAFSHYLDLPILLAAGEKYSASIHFTPLGEGSQESSAMVFTDENGFSVHSFDLSASASKAPQLVHNPGAISANIKMNEQKEIGLEIQNHGGSILTWSLKGANGLAGSSFSLANVFTSEHFEPLEKGSLNQRSGAPVSALGGGPDYFGYSWSDSSDHAGPDHAWVDISQTGNLLAELSGLDDGFSSVTLPFDFDLYGQTYGEIFVGSNGYLTLGQPSVEHGNFPLPTAMMPANLIAAFATDLDPASGGNIYYHADDHGLTVQYDKVKDFAGLGEYTFQIKVNAGGVIRFLYEDMNGPVDRATTGIQNASSDIGLLVAYNNQQIQSNSTIRISTSPKWLHTSKLQGSLEAGQSETVNVTVKSGSIMAGSYEAELQLTSNDPEQKSITIPVSLTIQEDRTLSLTPGTIEFGSVEVGLSKDEILAVTNMGNAPINLNSLNFSNGAFHSDFRNSTLQPGQSYNFNLTFKPDTGGAYSDSGILESDAKNSPNTIHVSGSGLATPKLEIAPEIVNISVEAGLKKLEKVALENYLGMAEGSFTVKDIRSTAQSTSVQKFNELNQNSGEIIPEDPFANEHSPNELIVSFKSGKTTFENASGLGEGFSIKRSLGSAKRPGHAGKALSSSSLILVSAENEIDLGELRERLSQDPAVDYVEPNYVVRRTNLPNDPDLGDQWALEKIQAANAWELAKGSESVVVAVIDTGIDYNHPDLKGNIWINTGEVPSNGVDDDGNGYVDDIHGWDFVNSDNDPMDGNNHGTHVAGTIAAATNNGLQVAGVSWHTKVVALKFLADGGWGYTSDAIDAIAYCAAMDIPISNNSWGGGGYSQALKDVINEAGDAGHLFCAAAGNSGSDNDQSPHYPANYDSANIISVAASNQLDELAYFSCYGKTTVDLAAPGTSILNLIPNGEIAYMSGTSMAAPHVAGAAALLLSQNPSAKHQELKNLLMNSVNPIESFNNKMVAPGRLNLFKALQDSSPSWLAVTPPSGTVPAGSKIDLDFTVDAKDFFAGTKHAIVTLNTNDPLANVIEVPVNLTITGTPKISVNPTSLDFGDVWVGKDKTLLLKISNLGTDHLNVSDLNFGHQAFFTTIESLALAPGAEEEISVTVRPEVRGDIAGNLRVNSNDPLNQEVSVDLTVKALTPPLMTYAPGLISVNLEPGENTNEKIFITNGGEATGEWYARMVETNVKRARNFDLNQIISGLNAEGRSPDFFNPGHALVLNKGASLKNEDVPNAIRYNGMSQNGLEVGVLGADYSEVLESIGLKLSELENVAGVTTINVSGLTPVLEEIKAFDAIIVFSNFAYWDNQALGDLVASYASTGGGVITMPGENLFFAESNAWSMGGEWRNQGLALFEMEPDYLISNESLGEINLPNHPLVDGIGAFSGDIRILHQKVNPGATIAASWADGTPLVTFRSSPNLVVDLNFYPNVDYWDTNSDGLKLIQNALNWTTRSFSPSWLSGTPVEGSVPGGSETTMELTFDATGLSEGNYTGEIHFSSNDPENSFFCVEVNLEVLENQAPVASPKTIAVMEDQTVEFALDAIDPDDDLLTYVVTQFPKFGSLEGNAPNFSYTPAKNFHGSDHLIFKATDGRKESPLTKVSFQVEAVNDVPWANSFEVNASEDEFFTVDFKYGDIDGDRLNLQISKYPINGFLWQDNGQWLYFPNNHFNGKDSLRYFVTDGEFESQEASVSIRLKALNDAPVARNLIFNTNEDTTVTFELTASDVDNDLLSYRIVEDPSHGRLNERENNQWTYTPFEEYFGEDTFTFQAFDGQVYGNIGSAKIIISEVNDPPVVQQSTFKLKEDGNIAIKLIASDPEGQPLSFAVTTAPKNGSITGSGPNYNYTPARDFHGVDTFEVQASDGSLLSEVAEITLFVESQNDAPYFEYNLATLSGGIRETPLRVKLEVKDVDNENVAISLSSSPGNGTCYIENEELVYLPTLGFSGVDNISIQLDDGHQSVTEDIALTINSHQNPFKINFDEHTEPLLVNMLYQANEILMQNGKPVFELDHSDHEELVSVSITEDGNFSGQDLSEWLKNVEDLPGGSFVFRAQEIENRLHWKVSTFLDPVSGADMDDNTSTDKTGGSSGDSHENTNEGEINEKDESEIEEVSDHPSVKKLPLIEDLGSDWYNAAGIGIFFDSGNGWIYQVDMGWCFLKVCPDQKSFWVFHESLGWFWMSQDFADMVYLTNESAHGWYYFPNETLAQSKFIYSYEQQTWYQWYK